MVRKPLAVIPSAAEREEWSAQACLRRGLRKLACARAEASFGNPRRQQAAALHRVAASGFTVAELITVCAIIAILAATTLPVARFGIRREKEIELQAKLRRITEAIDRYHDIMTIPPQSPIRPAEMSALGSEGYPKTLDDLVKGIKLTDGRVVKILRDRDLIDPMTGKKEWTTLSTTDDPDTTSSDGNNVFEVHSKSTALALDGKTRYNEW